MILLEYEIDGLQNDIPVIFETISKLVTMIGIIHSAAGIVFDFDSKVALTYTAVSGITWFLLHK